MSPETAAVVRVAIRGWPETLRFCLIVIVVAATSAICIYLQQSALPIVMK